MFQRIYKKYNQYITMEQDNKNYDYFYNEHGVLFGIDRQERNVYQKLSNIYIERNEDFSSSNEQRLYSYLFDNDLSVMNNRNFKFFIIDYYKNKKSLETIIEFAQEVINDCILFTLKEKLIIVYFDDYEIDGQVLTNNMYESLFKIKVFEGFEIDYRRPNDFLYILIAYLRYLPNYFYADISDLILEIVKNDVRVLRYIKPIVFKEMINDSQIEKVIKGMFENNLNVTKTASSVYMHRNTVNNKIEIIKNKTNLNIQNFKDATAIYFLINAK